jgi:hypothetical protein
MAEATLPADRNVRLLLKTSRGWQIVLTLPASKMEAAATWALQALELDPKAQWKFEETSGRLIRDKLWEFFRSRGV